MRELRGHRDEGFSLIEVIIAMVMIGIVASSALWFFINGMRTSSNLGRQQTAVSVATSALEGAFVVNPHFDATTGVSGLVKGRSSASVGAAFTALGVAGPGSLGLNGGLGIAGVSSAYPVFDPAGGTPVLPVTQTVSRAGINYTVYTLVGACYRTISTSGSLQNCEKYPGYGTSEPPAIPAGMARMLRVTVAVTWAPRGDECESVCHYDVSTIVDPSPDLVWNRVFDPEVVDDSWPFSPGDGKVTLVVLSNDWIASVPVNPVSLISGLPAGTGTLAPVTSTGTFDYTPPLASAWKSGIFSFTYQIRDIPGKTSQGKASIYLLPYATDDVATAYVDSPTNINVIGNDKGSPVTVLITSNPTNGVVTVSGTTVTYTASAQGPDAFTYVYKDASDQTSTPATVSISVQAVSIADAYQVVTYRPSATGSAWVDVSAKLRGVGGGPASITVLGKPNAVDTNVAAGELRIDGVPYAGGSVTGTKVEFQPSAGTVGEWTFPFSLTLGSYTTPQANATMKVEMTVANDSVSGTIRNNTTFVVPAGSNDVPTSWSAATGVTDLTLGTIPSGCGTWVTAPVTPAILLAGRADLTAGTLSIKTGSTDKSCQVTYTLTAGGTSATGTISYKVK